MRNKKNYINFRDWEKEQMKDPKFRAICDELEPEFSVIEQTIRAQIKNKISQKELAKRMGTHQSAISRLTASGSNPTFKFVKKLAKALDTKITVVF